jgi:beta-galactosidase
VIIAPAYQQIDKALIEKMTSYVKKGGNLVLTVRTGHQDRQGHLWEAPFAAPIYDLIGAEIRFYDLLMPHSPDSVLFNRKKYGWTSWGEILNPHPGTDTWATFQGDFYAGKPAITSTRLGNGTVTFVCLDSKNGVLEKEVLSRLFHERGIPIAAYPEGVMVDYRDGFGIAVNYSDKPFEMKLPDFMKVLIGTKTINTGGVLVWKY